LWAGRPANSLGARSGTICFGRIGVMEIYLPPLRERTGDVPLLAHGFAARLAAQFATRF
jgi:transcriptional regulator with PAS, ATPase and Fis domain